MTRHHGLIVVRFHGGFLDGEVLRSDKPITGDIRDYWHPRRLYEVTAALDGAFMSGVSTEGLGAIKHPSDTAPTVVLHHRYRVTQSHLAAGVLTIDVAYEFVTDESG